MASSYQTLSNVYSDVRYNAGKDSNTLADGDLLRLANKYFGLMVRELIDLNEDLYAEISYTDLVANQREYVLPTDNTSSTYGGGLVKLQRVEITYDGSNWYVANPISQQEIETPTVLNTDVNLEFEKTSPKYWFKDRSVWIAPIPESTDDVGTDNANLYIFWIKRPNEMTASTDIPELSKDFLVVLTEGMLIDVFRKYGRINEMRIAEARWNQGLARMRELESHPDQEQRLSFRASQKDYS